MNKYLSGKIDKYGQLWIKRVDAWRLQECPYKGSSRPCGDKCPFFDDSASEEVILRCQHVTIVSILLDERL